MGGEGRGGEGRGEESEGGKRGSQREREARREGWREGGRERGQGREEEGRGGDKEEALGLILANVWGVGTNPDLIPT